MHEETRTNGKWRGTEKGYQRSTGAWIGKVGTRERASDLEGARAKGSPVSARGLGSRSLRFRSTARADPFCN